MLICNILKNYEFISNMQIYNKGIHNLLYPLFYFKYYNLFFKNVVLINVVTNILQILSNLLFMKGNVYNWNSNFFC